MTTKYHENPHRITCVAPKFCTCPDLGSNKLKPLEAEGTNCRKARSLSWTIEKLTELIVYPVLNMNTAPRICSYLEDFINLVDSDGFYVKDLNSVMKILEFLALQASDIPDYQKYLDKTLFFCRTPPLLTKTSDTLFCAKMIEDYFTLLSYLLLIFPTVREVLIVYETIHRLLDRSKPRHIAAVKLETCHNAVEASILPVVLTEILEIATDEIFPRVLETTLLVVSVSKTCCYRMMEAGLLEYILIRLDPNYEIRLPFMPPLEILDEESQADRNQVEILVSVSNIMWTILNTAMNATKMPANLSGINPPSQSAMRSLRYAFRREVRCSRQNQSSLTMRNDLASMILAVLATFPGWKFVESGLVDDLVILSVPTELGIDNTWASSAKFRYTDEDIRLKKVLILVVCYLNKIRASVKIMKQKKLMARLLTIVNPDTSNENVSKNEAQFWELNQYALHAVCVLLPMMPGEFIEARGTNRLLMILEWSMLKEVDSQLILNCVKAVNSIVMKGIEIIRNDFCHHGAVGTVIKLVHFILSKNIIGLQHQRILTHAMMITEVLIGGNRHYQILYGEQGVKIVLKLLKKCMYDQPGHYQPDNRLVIALGTYIWGCIVGCPSNLKIFVEQGGIFAMLDVIDATIFPVRIIYLGALCDICEEGSCEGQICTWRGENKELGVMSLLARIWREEEIRIRAKRTNDGCIEDMELPLMGAQQWTTAYFSNRDHRTSPALAEMLGSCRPKIHAICKIIERNLAVYEVRNNHYKILLQEMPTEDRITMLIVDHYFRLKQGEVWTELQQDMLNIGIIPLRLDGEMIFLMLQSHRRRSLFIKSSQEAILKAVRDDQVREEKATYKEIIDSKLASTLDELHGIEYIARTTDSKFMRKQKGKQRLEVERALNFPKNVDPQLCHRTFLGKTNVTAIMDLQYIIQCEACRAEDTEKHKLMPVSPSI